MSKWTPKTDSEWIDATNVQIKSKETTATEAGETIARANDQKAATQRQHEAVEQKKMEATLKKNADETMRKAQKEAERKKTDEDEAADKREEDYRVKETGSRLAIEKSFDPVSATFEAAVAAREREEEQAEVNDADTVSSAFAAFAAAKQYEILGKLPEALQENKLAISRLQKVMATAKIADDSMLKEQIQSCEEQRSFLNERLVEEKNFAKKEHDQDREQKFRRVLAEFWESEKRYNEDLQIIQHYREAFRDRMDILGTEISPQEFEVLFGNLDGVIEHSDNLLAVRPRKNMEWPESLRMVKDIEESMKDLDKRYVPYLGSDVNVINDLEGERASVRSLVEEVCAQKGVHKLSWYTIMPMQRATRFRLLLQEFCKFSNGLGTEKRLESSRRALEHAHKAIESGLQKSEEREKWQFMRRIKNLLPPDIVSSASDHSVVKFGFLDRLTRGPGFPEGRGEGGYGIRRKYLLFSDGLLVSQHFTELQDAIDYDWVVGVHRSPVTGSRTPSGLKWEKTGATKPTQGRELHEPKLTLALAKDTTFTKQEWGGFGICDLRRDDFIISDGFYFKPAGKRSLIIRLKAKKNDLIWGVWPRKLLSGVQGSMWETVDADDDHCTEIWTSKLAHIAIRNALTERPMDHQGWSTLPCLINVVLILIVVALFILGYKEIFHKTTAVISLQSPASRICLSENFTIPPEPSEGLAQVYVSEKIPADVDEDQLHANPPVVLLPPRGRQPRQALPIKLNMTSSNGLLELKITVDVPPRADGALVDEALFDPLQYGERLVEIFFKWGTKTVNLSVNPPEGIRPAKEYLIQNALNGNPIRGRATIHLTWPPSGSKTLFTSVNGSVNVDPDWLPPGTVELKMTVHVQGYVIQPLRMMSHERLFSKARKTLPMTPPTQANELRVILKWGEKTDDLDLHGSSSTEEHVYYDRKENHAPNFRLDKDDRFGNGFETITLLDMPQGIEYWFTVHHYIYWSPHIYWSRGKNFRGGGGYVRENDLASSDATILIYGLNNYSKEMADLSTDEPVTISVPRMTSSTFSDQKDVWRVFKLLTDTAGRPKLSVVNQITGTDLNKTYWRDW